MVGHLELGSVEKSLAAQGVRVSTTTRDQIRSWISAVDWTSYDPKRACLTLVSYELAGTRSADGATQTTDSDTFTTGKTRLDTSTGTLTGTLIAKLDELTFEAEAPAGDGSRNFVATTYFYNRWTVEGCFDTPKPLADERSVTWQVASKKYATAYRFEVGAGVVTVPPPSGKSGLGFALDAKSYPAGAKITLTFARPLASGDDDRAWVTIVPAGSPPSEYGNHWSYVDDGARSITIVGPSEPGRYEARLHTNYPTLSFNVVHTESLTIR